MAGGLNLFDIPVRNFDLILQILKMVGDRVARQYRVYEASGNLPDPQFCSLPFNQQIALAFSGINTVSDPEHPVLRAMRGEIP